MVKTTFKTEQIIFSKNQGIEKKRSVLILLLKPFAGTQRNNKCMENISSVLLHVIFFQRKSFYNLAASMTQFSPWDYL